MQDPSPLTSRDREDIVKRAREMRNALPNNPSVYQRQVCYTTTQILKWNSTVVAAETVLVEMTRERDTLKSELVEVSADRDSWRHCAQNS